MVDLHKEIKLSDLFRRNGKGKAEAAPKPERKPKREKKVRDDRGGRRPFRRRERPPTEAVVGPKEAPALPPIPLMRAFDLLPKEPEREKASPLPLVLVALAAVLVVAGLAAFFLLSSARLADAQNRYDDLRGELAALEVPAEQPGAAGGESLAAEQQSRTAALAAALGGRVAWDRLLRELSLVLPEDVTLTTLVASVPDEPAAAADPAAVPPTAFTIGGFTEDQEGVALLLSRLSVIPELSSVQLVSASAVEGSEDLFQFTINAGIRKGGS